MNIKFSSPSELMSFLINTSDFQNWEVMKMSISTSPGIDFSMNTKYMDLTGTYEYIQFKKISSVVSAFWSVNANSTANIDIKLRYPINMKNNFDPNNQFKMFNLAFYAGGGLTMISATSVEKSLPSPVSPIEKWILYIQDLYIKWNSKYKNV